MEDIVPEAEARDHEDEVSEESSSGYLPKVVCRKKSEKDEKEEKEEEEKKGGIISHIISNLVSPLSPRSGQVSVQNGEVENGVSVSKSKEDVGKENHGGVMNNLISNLFPHTKAGEKGDEDISEKKKVVDEGKGKKEIHEEENGVVGIIDNIVSHFPTSIPDDAVPTTDEACILIHSIVKD